MMGRKITMGYKKIVSSPPRKDGECEVAKLSEVGDWMAYGRRLGRGRCDFRLTERWGFGRDGAVGMSEWIRRYR